MVNETYTAHPGTAQTGPLVSVIIINYNGALWLRRCLESLRAQTIFERIEVIVADNASPDESDRLAKEAMRGWTNGMVMQNGSNLGYSEGNNQAARRARGRFLLFLNNDTWLEPDCIERLVNETQTAGAAVSAPLVMDYLDNAVQFASFGGFDVFGLLSFQTDWSRRQEILVAGGCALLIQGELFRKLGGFDAEFFMYADEYDLCWRAWQAGERVIFTPAARLHHRSAASVNPRGYEYLVEVRTSDTKRFYANRNCLLVLLKNSQHLLLALLPLQLLMLALEASVMLVVTRRWSHFRRAYLDAVCDCWRLRGHIREERRRFAALRKRGDGWMLRWFRLRCNRWDEVLRMLRLGLPKVDAR
jgi:GT2 family glycosyltransferase